MSLPRIELIPFRAAVCLDRSLVLDVLVRIVPAALEQAVRRPAINLGLVLDRSGSMAALNKIQFAREAAVCAIEQLLPSDRVSVTIFDEQIETIVPNTPATNKAAIVGLLRGVQPRGSTALHAGWAEGANMVGQSRFSLGMIVAQGLAWGLAFLILSEPAARAQAPPRGYTIPLIDLDGQKERQVVVDREKDQYLGHVTTVLLEDNKTMIAVYPKGHGRGAIVMKRSTDAGKTWSDRLPVPASWATSLEVPTIHRVVDAKGVKRLILFSGLYPIRMAVSEDDGKTWSELKPIGDFGGIVAMGSVVDLKTGPGHYLALFHDDGRFFTKKGERTASRTLYKTFSRDGGLTWSFPEVIFKTEDIYLCEPGVIRSPDGKQLAVLVRENRRVKNSHIIFSNDEGKTWSGPRELPGALTGDRHTGNYAPDGRLFLSFRDTTLESPTRGDWVGWVGTYDDLVKGREGQYRVRLKKNHRSLDCAYPGVEVLPDGTFVVTTYGHWDKGEQPYVLSVRFTVKELDELARKQGADKPEGRP